VAGHQTHPYLRMVLHWCFTPRSTTGGGPGRGCAGRRWPGWR
jgi:hypothetical protein